MKYGLTRKLNAYDLDSKQSVECIATAGDYIQSQLWCQRVLKDMPAGIMDIYQTFAWAWYALKRRGELEKLGLGEELTRDELDNMTVRITVYMEGIEDDSLPLAATAEPLR